MRKIIKAVFICLLVTMATVPPAIATNPILEAFDSSWRVTSLYGPRYLEPGTKGTNPHLGVDFAPGRQGEAMGYMIKSRSAGVIADFGFISTKGWNLVIEPTDNTKNSHNINNIVYYHLFRNDGTVPEIKDSAFKKVKVVKVAKKQNNPNFVGPPEYCDAIAFWIDDTTLDKVLTRSACKGGIYENHQNVPAESEVKAGDEIAPVGNSSTARIGPHLHLTINDPVKRNPFYVVKPSSTSGSDSATFFKDLNDTNKLVSDKGLWFDIKTGKSLSLNSVSLLLKLANGTNIPLENIFNFGGAPNEKAINPNVTTTISNTYCINAPSGSYASPTNIGCDWDGTPNTKTWRFFYPYDIASLPSGTHQICLTAKDVSGNSILTDSCETFTTMKDGVYRLSLSLINVHNEFQAISCASSITRDFDPEFDWCAGYTQTSTYNFDSLPYNPYYDMCDRAFRIDTICRIDGQFQPIVKTGSSNSSELTCASSFQFDGYKITHNRTEIQNYDYGNGDTSMIKYVNHEIIDLTSSTRDFSVDITQKQTFSLASSPSSPQKSGDYIDYFNRRTSTSGLNYGLHYSGPLSSGVCDSLKDPAK